MRSHPESLIDSSILDLDEETICMTVSINVVSYKQKLSDDVVNNSGLVHTVPSEDRVQPGKIRWLRYNNLNSIFLVTRSPVRRKLKKTNVDIPDLRQHQQLFQQTIGG